MSCIAQFIKFTTAKVVKITPGGFTAVLFTLCCCFSQTVLAAPLVAVSIKPLQHLVAALTQGVSEPVLVLDGNQDPHNISLRPSERRALSDAALVMWIGPSLELPLADVMPQVRGKVVTVQNISGLTLLGANDQLDPHLWLNTNNASLIAQAVIHELSLLDPEHRERYEANLQQFLQALQLAHTQVLAQLTEHTITSWAVYHQAFAYFEADYALPAALRLKDSDNVEPGIRSAMAFKKELQEQQLDCIVTEPDVNPATVHALLDNNTLRIQAVDILGLALPVSHTSFTELLTTMATAITACAGTRHE